MKAITGLVGSIDAYVCLMKQYGKHMYGQSKKKTDILEEIMK